MAPGAGLEGMNYLLKNLLSLKYDKLKATLEAELNGK